MKFDVKLRAFFGAITEGMYYYLKPLLKKEYITVVLHIGTNDATDVGIDLDAYVERFLDIEKEIGKK